MAKGISNFGGKQAAPFGKRKSSATNRKKSSPKTAKGTAKKGLPPGLAAYMAKKKKGG